MPNPENQFSHAGISDVKEYVRDGSKSRVLRIPDRILGKEPPRPCRNTETRERGFLSYEQNVGTVIISNQELEKTEKYKHVNSTKLSDSNYRATIPEQFFNDFEPSDKNNLRDPVPEKARFQVGELRHFIYNQKMSEGQARSCYVLTEEQFNNQFSDVGRWDGDLSQIPRFIS